jgi:hypothetical protein
MRARRQQRPESRPRGSERAAANGARQTGVPGARPRRAEPEAAWRVTGQKPNQAPNRRESGGAFGMDPSKSLDPFAPAGAKAGWGRIWCARGGRAKTNQHTGADNCPHGGGFAAFLSPRAATHATINPHIRRAGAS